MILFSCNPFDPKDGTIESFTEIGDTKTIANLMNNFVYAYNTKDSLHYSTLLDSSFIFEYTDEYNLFSSWGRAEDLRITSRLFRSFERINLNFTSEFPESEADSITFITSFHLQISSGGQETFFSGRARYSCLRKYKNQDGVQEFTGYKIYHWQDLR